MALKLKYLLEALLCLAAWAVFRLLPLDAASWLGGRMGRIFGPLLRQHRTALTNLALVFPEKPESERRHIAMRMWDHLGRVLAEFSHFSGNSLIGRVSFSGLENLPPPGKAVIFVSGHFGNWELTYPAAYEHGVPITLVYRHFNNPYVDRMMGALRRSHCSNMIQKGLRGAPKMARALKEGESLAMLVDQKMNEGIAVPFFGHPAMTAPAFAQFAMRFNLPIIPAHVVRTGGVHFRAIAHSPLSIPKSGDEEADVRAILLAMHTFLEGWIREHPEQWFWVHRRWPKEVY